MDDALARIEAKLRQQAKRYVRQRIGAISAESAIAFLGEWSKGGEATTDQPDRAAILAALQRERMKSRSGSSRYDFNRHVALYQALAMLDGKAPKPIGPLRRRPASGNGKTTQRSRPDM